MSATAVENPALEVVRQELGSAIAATKCHRCSCYQDTVQALAGSFVLPAALASQITEAPVERAGWQPLRCPIRT